MTCAGLTLLPAYVTDNSDYKTPEHTARLERRMSIFSVLGLYEYSAEALY